VGDLPSIDSAFIAVANLQISQRQIYQPHFLCQESSWYPLDSPLEQEQCVSAMKHSDSTTPLAALWPPPAPQVAMAIFTATLEGKVTPEEIDAVEGLPPSKFPRELMVKLGYNPPLPVVENVSDEHQSTNPAEAQDGDSASVDEWPPDDMQILFAMRAAQMDGTFSQADADRMDEGPPETWPLDLWQKLGFAPPSPGLTQENPVDPPSSNVGSSDEPPGDLPPDAPITAVVNIRATGDVYRITRDTTSDPCDGEEVLVYDSVKVEVVAGPQEEEGTPLILESATFRPEDEDFPLRCMPPAPPRIGQVEQTTFWSRMETEIQLRCTERPTVRITHSGVMVADHHWSWETIHARGSLDQGYPATAYLHGVGLSAEMRDFIFNSRSRSAEPRRIIIRHLADEIDFIAAHTKADGLDASPAVLVHAMNDDPEAIMKAVLAMPWDHARRISGPAEVTQWIAENHPAITTTVNSSASPTPSSPHLEHLASTEEIMIGLGTHLPPQATKLDVREITRIAPDQWPRELQEALLPKWKDNKGQPLPTDQPMCNLKGELNYPERILV